MSHSKDQAYIDAIIAYANRKRCEVEYHHLLDLWEKTDLDTDLELAESLCEQIYKLARRIRELYQQECGYR